MACVFLLSRFIVRIIFNLVINNRLQHFPDETASFSAKIGVFCLVVLIHLLYHLVFGMSD